MLYRLRLGTIEDFANSSRGDQQDENFTMDYLRSVVRLLSSDEIVSQFQTFCGLERVSSDDSSNYQTDHPSSPKSKRAPSSPKDNFLTGDKGIDSLFAAVDRESGFESQEDLVERHIRHLSHHQKSSKILTTNNTTSNNSDGRIVPKSPLAPSSPSPVLGRYPLDKNNANSTATASPAYRIRYKLLYYIFRFGSSLGYEAFYATFFPIWTWNIDGAVCRRVVTMWVLTMYIGQVLKDILKLPRPSPKVVIQMEPMYVSEYGMPSTHAMVGFSVPFSLLYFCGQRYDFPFAVGLAICSAWCLLICLSRVYLGMHSVLDIIGGLALVSLLFTIFLPFADIADAFMLTSPIAPFVLFVCHIVPSLYYPQALGEEVAKGHWGPTWADTVTILAAGAGISIGSWLNYQMGIITAPTLNGTGAVLPPPYPIMWPSSQELVYCVLRAIVGLGCLATVRIASKTMAHLTVCWYYGKDPSEVKGRNLVKFELPVKFITYAAIGLSATFFIPALFRGFHIARDTMYTEV